MNQQLNHAGGYRHQKLPRPACEFAALALEQRSHVDTACAAYHLGRRPQTLRVWASYETGALRPIRVNGRLAWSVAEIRCLLQIL